MTKQTLLILAGVFVAIIAAVTLLLAMDKSPDRLIELLTVSLIPTGVALWAGNRADKATQTAEKAVENTNGRMGQLIQGAIDTGGKVDVDKYSDVIQHQNIAVPEAQQMRSDVDEYHG